MQISENSKKRAAYAIGTGPERNGATSRKFLLVYRPNAIYTLRADYNCFVPAGARYSFCDARDGSPMWVVREGGLLHRGTEAVRFALGEMMSIRTGARTVLA